MTSQSTNHPPPNAANILNIAAYHFVALPDADALCQSLKATADGLALKGTVLLAHEGINLFLAGKAAHINPFICQLLEDERFARLAIKRSWSAAQPFRKLIVRVKPEIIRMNHPTIKPSFDPAATVRAPAVDAKTLKRWLDQGHDDHGKPVVTLDTRNDFEVDYGTFKGAIDWRIKKFSEFPDAFLANRAELENKTVVSFCTGGIRCEKAAIFMREAGLTDVYQLEGGILKYFEETLEDAHEDGAFNASNHYSGACFVFDQREALGKDLKPQDLGEQSRFFS
ncbi:MAG: sulfurtransferase [Cytophagales bacterium]|nr:sulfurtransferase [Cytophagales bacterium]